MIERGGNEAADFREAERRQLAGMGQNIFRRSDGKLRRLTAAFAVDEVRRMYDDFNRLVLRRKVVCFFQHSRLGRFPCITGRSHAPDFHSVNQQPHGKIAAADVERVELSGRERKHQAMGGVLYFLVVGVGKQYRRVRHRAALEVGGCV